jgi:hypothetical protein
MILPIVESAQHFSGNGMNTLYLDNLEPLILSLYRQI